DLVTERLELLARVNQLLLVMISNERKGMTWGTNRRMPPELSREAPQSPEPQPDPPPAVHPDA
ncbi:MAG TPA: hypothetical protein VHM30_11410, partial [Gemmatimonadaceae bacterium]|nr:hypothetical protein [Gemmatimonadaceae bacterium]